MDRDVARPAADRPAAMQPVEHRQQRRDHEMARHLDGEHAAEDAGRCRAAPRRPPRRRLRERPRSSAAPPRRAIRRQSMRSLFGRHHERLEGMSPSQSISGVQQRSRARPLTTMPIWPSGRSSRVTCLRPRSGSASAAADKRRHDAIARRDHDQRRHVDLRRHDAPAADDPLAGAGQVVAVPADQAFARRRAGERRALVQPVLEQHELARRGALLVHAEEAAELLHREPRIERPEQRLQDIDRQLARPGRRRCASIGPADSRKAWPVRSAWKSQGAASRARPATRRGWRAASATVSVPPMQ